MTPAARLRTAAVREAALAQETLRRSSEELRVIARSVEPYHPVVADELRKCAEELTDARSELRRRGLSP